jgi:hypothetical protein
MNPDQAKAFADFQVKVQTFYDQTWDAWFADRPNAQKATLRFALIGADALTGGDPHFSPSLNEIYLPVGDGDLEDYVRDEFVEIDFMGCWVHWKKEMIHEMLHEWQYKKPCIPTAVATALNSASRSHFQGKGHGDDFCQAIVDQASYFDLTPEELLASI